MKTEAQSGSLSALTCGVGSQVARAKEALLLLSVLFFYFLSEKQQSAAIRAHSWVGLPGFKPWLGHLMAMFNLPKPHQCPIH